MLCAKSCLLLRLPTFYLVFSTFILLSHEASTSSHHAPIKSFDGMMSRSGHGGISYGRSAVLERIHVMAEENSTLVLAAETTHRRDPLDKFKYYKGGWNITEKHYFSSAGFTAVPLFVIAAFWFLGFGMFLLVISLCHGCCKHQDHDYSQTFYLVSLIFLAIFTIVAAIGCVVVFVGQGKFHTSTTETLVYVVDQTEITVHNLRNVSLYLTDAKRIGVNQKSLPPNIQDNIERIVNKINDYSKTLESKTEGNSHKIQHVLDSVRLTLIIIVSIMLLLAFLGFAFSVSGTRKSVYILVIIGWILVTVIFVLCGLFIMVQNAMADGCVAIEQWILYPRAHTALDAILPCLGHTFQEALENETKEVITSLIGNVNAFINEVANSNNPHHDSSVDYNQSGPPLPILCSPYNSDMTDRKCNPDEVNFSNAAEVWEKYVCQVSAIGICTTKGRLTPVLYDQMTAAINVSYALNHNAPFLVDVGDCTFVREIYSNITKDHCPELRQSAEMISIGLVIVSTALMLSVSIWLFYSRKRLQHQGYDRYDIAASADQDHSGREKIKRSLD